MPKHKVEASVDNAKMASNAVDTTYIYTREAIVVSYPLRQSKLVITSPYGWRRDPLNPSKKTFHSGVDLRAYYEPVYAMLAGKVIRTGYDDRSGNFITLEHSGFHVSYCHLSLIGVKPGDMVFAGEPIGMSGNTGRVTGKGHLHLGFKTLTNQPLHANKILSQIMSKVGS